jgi:hypothetical protein
MRFTVAILAVGVLLSVIYASRAQDSSTAEAERYIKDS